MFIAIVVPLYTYITIGLSFLMLMFIWVVLNFLLRIVLPQTFLYMYFREHMHAFLFDINVGMELLKHGAREYVQLQ